jgi:hypothetical protein
VNAHRLQQFRWPQVQRTLIDTRGDLTRCSVVESPIQRITNRLVADWIERVTHPRDDHSMGIWHFGPRHTERKMKRGEVVVSSVDDSQRNSADYSLR